MIDKKPILALCPHCRGEGCNQCKKGKIEVQIGTGQLFTEQCTNLDFCGFENGGHIVDGEVMKATPTGEPDWELRPCILCNGKTQWKHLGEI